MSTSTTPIFKVLVADEMHTAAQRVFQENGIEFTARSGMTEEELIAEIGGYHGLLLRSATKATQPVIEAGKNLKVIGRAGIGTDNIDKKAATEAGIVVMNAPSGNVVTTAEHTIALLLAAARQIPQAHAGTIAGSWPKSKHQGIEIHDKVLGIIGCGRIGSLVAERAFGMKMRVIVHDDFLSDERVRSLGVEKVSLEGLLKQSDFISLHTPKQDSPILGIKELAKMKPSVIIVNCARGELIDEDALLQAINNGSVAGAALDVFSKEPARDHPLFKLEQVVFTPHLGASTGEAQKKVAQQIAEQMSAFLLRGTISNALNAPSMTRKEAQALGPYLPLAEQLGSFLGQVVEGAIQKIVVEFGGGVSELNIKMLANTALSNVLKSVVESVNAVSAQKIAKARNIAVETHIGAAENFQSLVRIVVTTSSGEFSISGTTFGNLPQIVAINRIPIVSELGTNLLFIQNRNTPGATSQVTSILADAAINIAGIKVTPMPAGESALMLIQTDQPVEPALLAKINALELVQRAKTITLPSQQPKTSCLSCTPCTC